jgi:hypothetical protein
MEARDKAAELYTFDGTDPDLIIALRSAFRAGAEWQTEALTDQHEQEPRDA